MYEIFGWEMIFCTPQVLSFLSNLRFRITWKLEMREREKKKKRVWSREKDILTRKFSSNSEGIMMESQRLYFMHYLVTILQERWILNESYIIRFQVKCGTEY